MGALRKKSFTLIELLIVMGVISLLASVLVIGIPRGGRKGRDTKRISDLKQYAISLEGYMNANDLYPDSSGSLIALCGVLGMSSCEDDPSGVSQYQYVVSAQRTSYYIYSLLENPSPTGGNNYYVVCSNGNSGYLDGQPQGNTCPL